MKEKFKYCFFIFIYIIFMASSIYGYNLEILADTSSSENIYFYTIVKASQNSIEDFGNRKYGEDWKNLPANSTTNSSSYGITGILFHKEPLSDYQRENQIKSVSVTSNTETVEYTSKIDGLTRNLELTYSYPNWVSNENYNVAYVDEYNIPINLSGNKETDDAKIKQYINYNGGSFYKINNKFHSITNESGIIKSGGTPIGIYYNFTDEVNITYTLKEINGEKSVIYKYVIDKDELNKPELQEYFFEDDGSTKKIYISFVTDSGETELMYTAADFYANIFNPAKAANIQNMFSSMFNKQKAESARKKSDEFKQEADKIILPDENDPAYNSAIGRKNDYEKMSKLYKEIAEEYEKNSTGSVPAAGTLYHPYTKGVGYDNTPVRSWSAVNDYDNILIIKENKKTVYVDYVEEFNNSFSVLPVAPKNEKLDNNDKGFHEYSLNGSNWFDLLIYYQNTSENEEIYEKYEIDIEDSFPQKQAKFIRMSEEELNEKMGIDTEKDSEENEEDVRQPYRYDRLNYLLGSSGDTYETLSQKIYNNNPNKNKRALNVNVNKNNSKPLLVSFVYKSSNKQNLIVQVEHNAQSRGILPIADYANEVLNGKKTSNSNEKLAEYSVNSKYKSSYAKNLETGTYTMQDGTKATYNNTYKVEFYKSNSTKPALTKKYNGSIYQFNPNDLVYNSSYTKIKVIFYYDVKVNITQTTTFNPCTSLSFISNFTAGTENCEQGQKGYVACPDPFDPEKSKIKNTEYIRVPTNESFYGKITTPVYSIMNLKYYIQLGLRTEKNIKKEEKWEVLQGGTHPVQEYVTTVKVYKGEKIGYVDQVIYRTVQKPHYYSVGPKVTYNSYFGDMEKTWAKRMANGTRYLKGLKAVTDLGMLTQCEKRTCSCGQTYWVSKTEAHFYQALYISFEPKKFNGYYLTKAAVINFNNDSTKFIGSDKNTASNSSLVVDTGESFSLLEEKINSLKTESFPTYCNDSWKETTAEVKENGQIKYVTYQTCDSTRYTDIMYGAREIELEDNYTTDNITPTGKYNGERLAIAQATYFNYDRIMNMSESEINNRYDTIGKYLDYTQKGIFEKIAEQQEVEVPPANDEGCVDVPYFGFSPTSSEYEHEIATTQTTSLSNTSGVYIANSVTLDKPKFENTSDRIISQTLGSASSFILQQGVETKITPKLAAQDTLYGTKLTPDKRKEYVKCYVYYFSFPVLVNGTRYDAETPVIQYVNGVDQVLAGNDSHLDTRGAINFTPIGYDQDGTTTSSVNYREDSITVMALTVNVPQNDIITFASKAYQMYKQYNSPTGKYYGISNVCEDAPGSNDTTRNDISSVLVSYGKSIRNDAYYVSNIVKIVTSNISRVYDFQITDCTDVNYKNVFRKNTNSSVIEHTGITYKSGIRYLEVFSNRHLEIENKDKILPLGPYKQTGGYVDAPKMGYRISFDLKTSGYYEYDGTAGQKRTVVIFPKLYYISKDGNTFIEDVNAYYRNSSGKYEKITQIDVSDMSESSLKNLYKEYANGKTAGGYKISYIPNDGYRNVTTIGITQLTDMFTKEKTELDTASIILTKKNMCTNNLKFIQTWYGEYKLPNSTILVKQGETNLNNYLKDGYCGVIFYIGVVEEGTGYDTVVISYNHSDKKRSDTTNTTQWDYEGFLGYPTSQIGSKLQGNLRLQLAKGIWNIDNEMYQKIKGTVLLYDLDNKASSDFE